MTETRPLQPATDIETATEGDHINFVNPPAISGIISRNLPEVEQAAGETNQEAPLDKFFRLQLENLNETLLWEGIRAIEDMDFPLKPQTLQTLNDVATAVFSCKGTRMANYDALTIENCRDVLEKCVEFEGCPTQVKILCQLALSYCEKLEEVADTPEYGQLLGVTGVISSIRGRIRGKGSSPNIEIVISQFLVKKIEACEAALLKMDEAAENYPLAEKKFLELVGSLMDELLEPEIIAIENSPLSKRFKVIVEVKGICSLRKE